MDSIKEMLKDLAKGNFEYSVVTERNDKSLFSLFNTPVKDSAKMRVFPKVSEVKVKNVDTLHDEVTLLWADLEVKGIVTWQEGKDNGHKTYRLISYE